jgi:uncharacterized protein (DUF1810 family)
MKKGDKMDITSLERFVEAQRTTYERALEEIKGGRKRTHWMWFVFPQLRALGRSETAYAYGIADAAEARAYLAHPVLSLRLYEISEALLAHKSKKPEAIFGHIDAVKLRSSMTLFALIGEKDSVFYKVLDLFYGGEQDPLTLSLLKDQ